MKEFIQADYDAAELSSVSIQASSQRQKARPFAAAFADVGVGLDDAVLK